MAAARLAHDTRRRRSTLRRTCRRRRSVTDRRSASQHAAAPGSCSRRTSLPGRTVARDDLHRLELPPSLEPDHSVHPKPHRRSERRSRCDHAGAGNGQVCRFPDLRVDIRRPPARYRHPGRKLADAVNRTIARGGSVIVPSFAVGRAQALMHLVERLKAGGAIPPTLPVYLNSPMAIDVTTLCQRFIADHRLTADGCAKTCAAAKIVNSVDESKALNASSWPKLIIAGSGMATGGRVLHHLRAYAPDPRSTILLTGVPSRGYAWPRAAGRRAINQAVRRIRAGPRGNRVARQPLRACRLRRDSRLASQLRARAADDLRHARRAGCR